MKFLDVIFKQILVIDGWGISALRWMSLNLIDDKSTLVQEMAWRSQATSHYLSQCWPRSLSPYGVTRPQWVKMIETSQMEISRAFHPVTVCYCQTCNIRQTSIGNKLVHHKQCSIYIFILDFIPGFNGLGKDKCKARRETFQFLYFVCLIWEVWKYPTFISQQTLARWQLISCWLL